MPKSFRLIAVKLIYAAERRLKSLQNKKIKPPLCSIEMDHVSFLPSIGPSISIGLALT